MNAARKALEQQPHSLFQQESAVQGPVENHAQIPKRIFVMKGGTADIKNRNIFTRRVEVHNFGLGS